jgi:hypothetical protein
VQLVCTRGPGRTALLIAIGLMFAQQVCGRVCSVGVWVCGRVRQDRSVMV